LSDTDQQVELFALMSLGTISHIASVYKSSQDWDMPALSMTTVLAAVPLASVVILPLQEKRVATNAIQTKRDKADRLRTELRKKAMLELALSRFGLVRQRRLDGVDLGVCYLDSGHEKKRSLVQRVLAENWSPAQHLKGVPAFQSLSEAVLEKVASDLHSEFYKKGERILTKGETGTRLFLIKSGAVGFSFVDPQTAEPPVQVVNTRSSPEYFGEIALVGEKGIVTAT
jgi:hypothetical protein